jgi:hypothetical protein
MKKEENFLPAKAIPKVIKVVSGGDTRVLIIN